MYTNRNLSSSSTLAQTLLVGAILCLVAPTAIAQVSVSAGVESVSQYIWRGYALTSGSAVQPALDFAWEDKGISLGFWGSAAVANRGDDAGVDELDATLNWSVPTGSWGSFDAGVILYTFPSQGGFSFSDNTSPEFYVNVAPSAPLSPEIFVAYDANLGSGFFSSAAVSQAFGSATLGAGAGYNHGQFGASAGVSHYEFSAGTDLAIGGIAVSPRLVFVRSFENTGSPGSRLFFGLNLSL